MATNSLYKLSHCSPIPVIFLERILCNVIRHNLSEKKNCVYKHTLLDQNFIGSYQNRQLLDHQLVCTYCYFAFSVPFCVNLKMLHLESFDILCGWLDRLIDSYFCSIYTLLFPFSSAITATSLQVPRYYCLQVWNSSHQVDG